MAGINKKRLIRNTLLKFHKDFNAKSIQIFKNESPLVFCERKREEMKIVFKDGLAVFKMN